MKQNKKMLKSGEIFVTPESAEDLWQLSHIIEPGDIVKGKTVRKIKIGGAEDRKAEVVKKTVFLSIQVEKIELAEDILRISGIILEGTDDIAKGVHHTISLEPRQSISIIKKAWLSFQLEKLDNACSEKKISILIIVHDREEAIFAILKQNGYEIISTIKGKVEKKAVEQQTNDFYKEIAKNIEEYAERYNVQTVLLASTSFFKEHVFEQLKSKDKVILATCSSVSSQGIEEVLRRDEAKKALEHAKSTQELIIVDKLLEEISKDGACVYGFHDCVDATNAGAVKDLLVSENYIKETREKGEYEELDKLFLAVEGIKGKIHILETEGARLDGIGGIGALLRFKLS